jgi:cytochrome d ubiquinol oxidase subunit II
MDLNTLWFVLVAVLFIGFFVLEGFDYGVGILMPFLGKTDRERRQIINTIGPFWDGNEVWILTAGGAIFAAFPHWYATMFSGFYLALVVLLLALIARGVAFEFRSKDNHPAWRRSFDQALFWGSALPALLWGVALANLLGGIPVDADKHYVGSFFDLLTPYTLLCGVTTLTLFTLHGALFLELKSDGEVRRRALATTKRVGPLATVLVLATGVATYLGTDAYERLGVNPGLVPVLAVGCLLAAGLFVHDERTGWAFAMTSGTIVFLVATLFLALYPRVVVSSLDPSYSLTIHNAASSAKTLGIMSVVALVFVPIVLAYQAWTYWVFRHRVTSTSKLEY